MAREYNKIHIEPIVGLWNRLEGRPTKHDFSQVLSAEIYDPLWMLNRQWQFGEFKGEDTGSAVFSQVQLRNSKISRFASGNRDFSTANVEVFDNDIPLEAKVESEIVELDLKAHLQISVYWKRLLNQRFGHDSGLLLSLLDGFKATYTLIIPTFATVEDAANIEVHQVANQMSIVARAKWLLDSERLYSDLSTQLSAGLDIQSLLPSTITLSLMENGQLNQIASDLIEWFDSIWVKPLADAAWEGRRLEYQFANAVPNSDPTAPHATLLANEYYHGKLDWYAYDLDSTNTDLNNKVPLADENIQRDLMVRTLFPSPVRFQGMPVSRWWEFEGGNMDFGKIYNNTNDTAHILLAQFGLLYSNDWQIIPFKIPVGSLSEISQLVVTDVFGQKTVVESANSNLGTSDWDYWAMFNLEESGAVPDDRLLYPPTVHKTMESDPIEEVVFARDEVSNIVWAIEKKVANPLGKGVDWDTLSREKKQWILDQVAIGTMPIAPLEVANYQYDYMTDSTPENWIPFVSRYRVAENRMVLQRGVMERNEPFIPDAIKKIRPVGKILNENTDGEVYFLENEEIPKEGVKVIRSFQRTRWFNGKVVNWVGRKKIAALGQIYSPLEFDTTTNFNKAEE
jgi:hypothetical protein